MVQNSYCMILEICFLKYWTFLVQNSYCIILKTYSWQIRLFWYKIRTLWVSWHISEGLDYFGTKFVLYEFRDIFMKDLPISVQNSYVMSIVTYFWRTTLFWYKIRTLWILRHISEGFDYFGTKFVLYEFRDIFLKD